MTTARTTRIQLDRAYVHSKVIEANLGRLRTVLSDCSPGLGDDLDSFTRTFTLYVGRLRDASTAAITDE